MMVDVNIDDKQYKVQACSGGNNIYLRLDKGLRICFAAQYIQHEYLNKIKLITKILSSYVPRIYETGMTDVVIEPEFSNKFSEFVKSMNIPNYLIEKFVLLNTLRNNHIGIPYIVMEHLESVNHSDPFKSRLHVDDLRVIVNSCLDVGIYVSYMPRVSNVIETSKGFKYLDFDEWSIIDDQIFKNALIRYKL